MIPEDKIAAVRESTDIVALVQNYVSLKRVGASFRGLCPFHSEKSPSFYVHPARQFFHCFGCQASGDAVSFLMRLEGRPFPDVVRQLAEQAGITLPSLDPVQEAAQEKRKRREQRYADLMDAVTRFYESQLETHEHAHHARDELVRRNVSEASVTRFRLGYAPHGWDALSTWLEKQGFSAEDAETLGLIAPRKRGRGYYDRFRHRLMFPIRDVYGRVVAFSGRELPKVDGDTSEPGAKYINSPEGPLYKKGEILFGLHEGRVAVRREGWLMVCEGNFDLVALHQAGFENSVAPMGTAFTENHAKLIRRYASSAVLMFDGDKAGRKAVRMAYPLLQKANVGAKVISLPQGEDPDTFLRAKGVEGMRALADNAPDIVTYLIDDAADYAGGDPRSRAEAIAALGPVLKDVQNAVEIELHIQRVAKKFGISDLATVKQQLRQGVLRARSEAGRGRGARGQSNQGRGGEGPRDQGTQGGAARGRGYGRGSSADFALQGSGPAARGGRSDGYGGHFDDAGYAGGYEGAGGFDDGGGFTDAGGFDSLSPARGGRSGGPGAGHAKSRSQNGVMVSRGSGRPIEAYPLEAELVTALIDKPALFASEHAKKLENLLTCPDLRAIFQTASRMMATRGTLDGPALLTRLVGQDTDLGVDDSVLSPSGDDSDTRAEGGLRGGVTTSRMSRSEGERMTSRGPVGHPNGPFASGEGVNDGTWGPELRRAMAAGAQPGVPRPDSDFPSRTKEGVTVDRGNSVGTASWVGLEVPENTASIGGPRSSASARAPKLSGPGASAWLEARLAIEKYEELGLATRVLEDGVAKLEKQALQQKRRELERRILEARRQGDDAKADELTRERDVLATSGYRANAAPEAQA